MADLLRMWLCCALAAASVLICSQAQARHMYGAIGDRGDRQGTLECAGGQELRGFSGKAGLWIDRISLKCARRGADGNYGPLAGSAYVGGDGGADQEEYCDSNQRLEQFYFDLTNDNRRVLKIFLICSGDDPNNPRMFGNATAYKQTNRSTGGNLANYRSICDSREVPTGITVNYGAAVNAIGLICDKPVAPPVTTPAAPPPPPKVIKHTGKAKVPGPGLSPVAAFGGKWETATNLGGHFELILQTAGEGIGMGGMPVQMQVGGSFTNTDGAHDYDGTISGLVPPGSRQLIYNFSQKNGQGGNGTFTLSTDGNSLTGEGVANGTHFTWSGHRAP